SSRAMKAAMDRPDVRIVPIGGASDAILHPDKAHLPETIANLLQHPDGTGTDLAAALKTVANNLVADSTVVLISDGRQNLGADPVPTARLLAARGARVFALTIGSHDLVRDAAVEAMDAPDWVFTGDDVVVLPVLRLDGIKPDEQVVVEFRRNHQLIEQTTVKAPSAASHWLPLQFKDRPTEDGTYEYEVAIRPLPDEAVTDNNRRSVRVSVKHDQVKVLLVEDEPRWEYQFLRNDLARDHRVKLQAVLLEPGRIENVEPPPATMASPDLREGRIDAQVLPRTQADWAKFDVVILGDVPPERFGADEQKELSAGLRDGQIKGLVLIAGPRNMPGRYASAPLGGVVPVELSGGRWDPKDLEDDLRSGCRPALAAEGAGSVLGQLSPDAGVNGELWNAIPLWYWHSDLTQARPGAGVVWTIGERDSQGSTRGSVLAQPNLQSDRRRALLATMSYGLGRVLYLASPETWRMRYVSTTGTASQVEDLHRRFWGQAIRWASGSDLPAGGKFVRFGTDKQAYASGEPVIVTARVLGKNFTPLQDESFQAVATRRDGSVAAQATMAGAPLEGAGTYRGTLQLPPGSYSITLHGGDVDHLLQTGSAPGQSQSIQIDVQANALVEDRDVNTDPARMQAIAAAGKGAAFDGPSVDMLAKALPVVDRTEVEVTRAGLYTNPDDPRTRYAHWAFFSLFLGLITAEWVLRKRAGLI
ncbi:MAG TPA: hypothetical protein VN541_19665, partial [Tepidisphaeraceae bacterium]|nr:hypothetical protein [Tepidisphaeraceae bacterium]